MSSLKAGTARTGHRIAVVTGLLMLAACLLATPRTVIGQEQGVTPTKDTIFARKILMGSIDMNMDEIETMLAPEGTLNLAEGQEHADIISIMLMAFPHMFPVSTNQWAQGVDRDPATDTFASPDVWSNFADFYQRAAAASKIAFDASHAKRGSEFRALILQLRTACNSCHAAYQKID
jgi:cytochrome c556